MDRQERLARLRSLSPAQRDVLVRSLGTGAAPPATAVPPATVVPRRAGAAPGPLSFAQRRLWYLEQLTPGSAAYHVPFALWLEGTLDTAALAWGLAEIARRHEVLRSRFFTDPDGEPLQELAPAVEVTLRHVDLAALPEARRSAEAQRLAVREARVPFDLAHGPLARAILVRCDPTQAVLLLTLHHIASDAWSDAVLLRELCDLYRAALVPSPGGQLPDRGTGAAPPAVLPPLPIQYADFAAWQRQWLRGERLSGLLDYWRRQLAGAPPLLALPTDRPRAAQRNDRGTITWFSLPAELSGEVSSFGREHGLTEFMTLLAAFQALLGRYTGMEDLLVGTPIANRHPRETELLIGCFVNTLALRGRPRATVTFRSLARAAFETALGGYEHQDLPFEMLLEELRLERDLSHTPLVQAVLTLEEAGVAECDLPGLRLSMMRIDRGKAKFDLTMWLKPDADSLRGALEYATDLFDESTITRLLRHFAQITGAALRAADLPLGELPILDAAERLELVAASGAAGGVAPAELPCLHELFAARARMAGDAVALVDGDRRLTYERLACLGELLAGRLRGLGVGAETRVGICLEPSAELVIAMLGVLAAGGAYVPLDPAYPPARRQLMLDDAAAPVLIGRRELLADLPGFGGHTLLLDGAGSPLAAAPLPAVDPRQAAYVIYTSGSTGRPKGVVVTHANVSRLFAVTREGLELGPSDVWTLCHSSSFDFSVWEIWGALLHGSTLVIVPRAASREPESLYELLHSESVTVLNQTPSAFLQLQQVEEVRRLPLCLRLIVFGGEALEPRSLRPWLARHGDRRPRLVNMYGITETTVHATWHPISDEVAASGAGSPIGAPLGDLAVFVLDRRLEPVPAGVVGELVVGGAGVSRGYLGHPDLTAERFVPDPHGAAAGGRLYRSGDLGRRRAGGALEYLGRLDQQVKVRGYRIEPGEIEAALSEQSQVSRAVVLARPDPEGAGGNRLVAYVESHGAGGAFAAELRDFLRRRLPDHLLPAWIVVLAALPLTANGKVDRGALPAPDGQRPEAALPYAAPRNEREELLAAVWAEVIGPSTVGIDDGFFAIGGDSMRAVQVQARMRRHGLSFRLQELYAHTTIRGLAPCLATLPAATVAGGAAPGPDPLTADEELAALLERVESLPEEAVRRELGEQRDGA